MIKKYWVAGPSGSGKSHMMRQARAVGLGAVDLDHYGYREGKSWTIPVSLFQDFSFYDVLVGASASPTDMAVAAWDNGFIAVVLIPVASKVAERRALRGDSQKKIEEAEQSVESWRKLAKLWSGMGPTIVINDSDLRKLDF